MRKFMGTKQGYKVPRKGLEDHRQTPWIEESRRTRDFTVFFQVSHLREGGRLRDTHKQIEVTLPASERFFAKWGSQVSGNQSPGGFVECEPREVLFESLDLQPPGIDQGL